MAVIRNKRTKHYTVLGNDTLRQPNLTLKAKGLLAVMLSFPDDWSYNLTHVETQSLDGRDAHRAALRELIEAGYARWQTVHNQDGTLAGRELIVSDEPNLHRGTENPADGTTVGRENRRTGKPSDGKSDTTKNDLYEVTTSTNPPLPPKPEDATEPQTVEGMGWTGTDRTKTPTDPTSHLVTHHPRAHRALVDFRRMHHKPVKDAQFKAWAGTVLEDVRAHGEPHVVDALSVTIENFPSLGFPFAFYRKALERATAAPTASDATATPLPDAISDLIEQAKAGTL